MGFYMQVPSPENKALQVIDLFKAERVKEIVFPPPPDKVLICVVRNPGFDAIAIAYCRNETEEFLGVNYLDNRPKDWFLINESYVLEQHPQLEQDLREGRLS